MENKDLYSEVIWNLKGLLNSTDKLSERDFIRSVIEIGKDAAAKYMYENGESVYLD